MTFRAITNGSLLTFADGTPIYWLARLKGAQSIAHLPGPDFMLEILERFPDQGHFFYGSTPEVLSQMQARLRQRMPHLRISGMLSPPFRAITSEELQAHYSMIRESEARFVWVGLGAPKQERWMSESWRELKPAVLLGVGAAFDFCAGALRRAPPQMRAVGLEWLYRLGQEPKRLWKRYLVNNSLFIGYALPDILSRRQETTRN